MANIYNDTAIHMAIKPENLEKTAKRRFYNNLITVVTNAIFPDNVMKNTVDLENRVIIKF